jgi:protein-S-isoprenylcysteine O-methyltransferase Ste14
MNRLPWAPLNASVFLIILGGVILGIFFTQTSIFAAFPLIFTFFGAWMIVEAFVFPPADAYAPPRAMVVGWGSLIGGLGVLLLVIYFAAPLLPIVFAVGLVLAGIAGVAYSFRRASPTTPKTSAS